ncbi:MAG: hypothetical protein U0228_00635 [Myxococcaceae bacterium]
MRSLLLAALVAAPAFAEPEVDVQCPAGMHFETGKGCKANVVTAPECPAGTHADGKKCVANVDTSCPAGMHFVAGTGCVANTVKSASTEPPPPPAPPPAAAPAAKGETKKVAAAPPPPARPAPAAEPENPKKGGTFSGNPFGDRLRSSCNGIELEVTGAARFTGVRAQLLANGTRVGNEEIVDVGVTKHITGTVSGKAVDLRVTQAVFGTRYLLKVGTTECKLTK